MAEPRSGQGTQLFVADGDAWVQIPHLRNVTIARTRANINVTDHDSPNRTIRYKKALKEPGKLQADTFFIPEDAGNILLDSLYEGEDEQTWMLVLPEFQGGPQGYFLGLGYVDDLSGAQPSDGNMQTRKVQIQRSGAWPFTAGAQLEAPP